MKKICLFVAVLVIGCVALPHRSPAPLVIKPGEDATYVPPGGEEIPNQKDAQTQFDKALEAEKRGRIGVALAGYKKTVRRFPKSTVAAAAAYKVGAILEKQQNLAAAADAYERLILNYPHSTDFNAALESEYRIGTLYLDGIKSKLFGVPLVTTRQKAVAVFTVITRNAPYSKYAPAAQFGIGQSFAFAGDQKAAITAYQDCVDKYPADPIAADALYQIGFSYLEIMRGKSYDRSVPQSAREAFEDFLAAYPNHEKAAQAKENLASLGSVQTGGSLKIADYYYKQKQFRAAVVYYNDVIRQQPDSPDSQKAKTRLDSIRSKYGEKYFTDKAPLTAANRNGGVNPKLSNGDGRLPAQTQTASRPDYVGPPVSAPTPPPAPSAVAGTSNPAPTRVNPAGANTSLPDATPGPGPTPPRGEPKPPAMPEGEQPSLPSQ